MRVLITGADGFIGKNLKAHLSERKDIEIMPFTRRNTLDDLLAMLEQADFVFHLAGVNRTPVVDEFNKGNCEFTQTLCDGLLKIDRLIPVLFTSSAQATFSHPYADGPYATSKRDAETILENFSLSHASPVYVYRLPNVFGKWCKPNYNSAVATFCHNISRNLPICINDLMAEVSLVYIDDVVKKFIDVMDEGADNAFINDEVDPIYKTTVGELASQIQAFHDSRNTRITEAVGTGFLRALYSTYISYLTPDCFSYPLVQHTDSRGVFVEMLKTKDSGQFSFFTAYPGITRGGHYHHSKTEKFLVIKGRACFHFRHISSGEKYELMVNGEQPEIVDTVPGWTHDITNVGTDEMIVMLWANEIFDHNKPDTYACAV